MSLIERRVNAAAKAGDLKLFRKAKALLLAFEGYEHEFIADVLDICENRVGGWLRQFMLERFEALNPGKSPGRPPKLTASQKEELAQAVERGPGACGYPGACWRSPMIQDFIMGI